MSDNQSKAEKMEENFLENHSSNPDLAKAVIEQMGGSENFAENANDISSHGIDGGFNGFVNYTDTVKFTEENYGAIMDSLKSDMDNFGNESVPEMMSHWKSLNDLSQDEIAEVINGKDPENENYTQVYNALAWNAAEQVSYEYSNALEDLERAAEPEKVFDTVSELLDSEHKENLSANQIDMLQQIEQYLDLKNIEVGSVEVESVFKQSVEKLEVEIIANNYQLDSDGAFKEDVHILLTTENGRDVAYVGNSDEAKPYTIDGLGEHSGVGNFDDMKNKLGEHLLDKIEISTLERDSNQVVTATYHDNDHSTAIHSLNNTPDGAERLLQINGENVALHINDPENPKEQHFVVVDEALNAGQKIGEHWNEPNQNAIVTTPQEQGGWKSEILDNQNKTQERGNDKGMEMD